MAKNNPYEEKSLTGDKAMAAAKAPAPEPAPDPLANVRVGRFRKTAKTAIRCLSEDTQINTKEGPQAAQAGMFVATGVNGEEWALGSDPDSSARFMYDNYMESDEKGFYTKMGTQIFLRLPHEVTVHRPDYPEGHRGTGWLSTSGYIIGDDELRKSYELAEKID